MHAVLSFLVRTAAVALLSAPAIQTAAAQTIDELARDQSPNRGERLQAAAKKEGAVTFYTSIPEKDMAVLAADFESRYGVKVNVWRASTQKVLQRIVTEAQGRRFDFDAVDISSPELEALHREKLLQEVWSHHHADLVPGTMPAHREWAPQFLSVFVQAYNTAKIRKEDVPQRYEDLLNPRFKGALGIEANDQEWLCGVIQQMGDEQGKKFFRELRATNGLSVRSGHSLLTNLVVSGEVPLALTVYSYMSEQAKQRGAPVDWFAIEPAVGRSNGIGVSRRPPHPNAALLFYEYMIAAAQPLMVKMNYLPASIKAASPLGKLRVKYLDPAASLDERDTCQRLWEELIENRGPK
jgi:iron(III) transport system substrate-binding protein